MHPPSAFRLVTVTVIASLAATTTNAQLAGTNTIEMHPLLTTQTCSKLGCKNDNTSIVLDSNWRWLHKAGGSTNCYTGNKWDDTVCKDPETCATSCALDGADYTGTYGINADADAVSLTLVTKGPYSTNIGSRLYVLQNDDRYKLFMLLNQEFAFDVDVSKLNCGLNGALYFVAMDADGGMKRFSTNKAGAKYGTGYCDAQCPRDIKFISGEANVLNWTPSEVDPNAGTGKYGSCCGEMDIWEGNSISSAYTSHPCSSSIRPSGSHRCVGDLECGAGKARYKGPCDKDGCDNNPFRMGVKDFFGPGPDFTIDTTKKFTVVTRFITDDNTPEGDLVKITRFFVQNGKSFPTPASTFPSLKGIKSLTDNSCAATKTLFGDINDHKAKGGLKQMGETMKQGMVLTISLWTDSAANCLWLDSDYPLTANPSKPGVSRGTCKTTSGVPKEVIAEWPEANVKFSNIRIGGIGETTKGIGRRKRVTPTTNVHQEVGGEADVVTPNDEVSGEADVVTIDKEAGNKADDDGATDGANEKEGDKKEDRAQTSDDKTDVDSTSKTSSCKRSRK